MTLEERMEKGFNDKLDLYVKHGKEKEKAQYLKALILRCFEDVDMGALQVYPEMPQDEGYRVCCLYGDVSIAEIVQELIEKEDKYVVKPFGEVELFPLGPSFEGYDFVIV